MDKTSLFNLETLLFYTENDRDLAAQLLEMTLQDLPDFHNKSKEAFKGGDGELAAKYMHKLKGIAGVCGCYSIAESAQSCERQLLDSEEEGDLLNLFDQIEDMIRQLISMKAELLNA